MVGRELEEDRYTESALVFAPRSRKIVDEINNFRYSIEKPDDHSYFMNSPLQLWPWPQAFKGKTIVDKDELKNDGT
jgi:hypothetical protein